MNRYDLITEFHNKLVELHDNDRGYAISGWGSSESQRSRFDALIRTSNFSGGSIIDYGCGCGDLLPFLKERFLDFQYTGVDQSDAMLNIARIRHGDFFNKIACDAVSFPDADYIFASGIFQFNDIENMSYYKSLIRSLFKKSKKAFAFNLLSSERDNTSKISDELYISPVDALQIANSITKFWVVDHSYHLGAGDMTIALFNRDVSPDWTHPLR